MFLLCVSVSQVKVRLRVPVLSVPHYTTTWYTTILVSSIKYQVSTMESASKAKNEARLTSPLLRCCVLFGRVANSHYFSIEPATRCNTLQQSQRTARAIAGIDDFRFSTSNPDPTLRGTGLRQSAQDSRCHGKDDPTNNSQKSK